MANQNVKPVVPKGWVAVWDDNYQEWFYVDESTEKSQWEAPPGTTFPPEVAPPSYNASTSSNLKGNGNANVNTANAQQVPQQAQAQAQAQRPIYGGGYAQQQPMYGGGYAQQQPMYYQQQPMYAQQQQPQRSSRLGGMGGMLGGAALGGMGGLMMGSLLTESMMSPYGGFGGPPPPGDYGGDYGGGDYGGGDFDGGDFGGDF